MEHSLAGQLLLASPNLRDPNFARTVVLIGIHTEEGAMGLVLNRPSQTTVVEAVPALKDAVGEQEPVFVGGPVQPNSVVCLGEFEDPSAAAVLVLGRIGFPSHDVAPELLRDVTARTRVFAGFAGWGEGQLEAEMDEGDWLSSAALAEDVFSEEPLRLWSTVLARKGGGFSLLARMPLDPSMN